MGLISSVYNQILETAVLSVTSMQEVIAYLVSADGLRSSPSKRLSRLQLQEPSADFEPQMRRSDNPICIFAAYASDLTVSAFEYLTIFKRLGFRVVYINNSPISRKSRELLSPLVWMAFDRPNQGQDFGVYKDGILWLEANGYLNECSALAIVNDSMQFIPGKFARHFTERIGGFLSSDSPALFSHVSQQSLPHYQSFFQVLKPEVFLSRPFLSFWKQYIPYSHRFHCIYKGEIKISQKVYNKLSGAQTLYSSEALHQRILEAHDNSEGIVADDLVYLMPSPYRTLIKKIPNPALNQLLGARESNKRLMRSELICVSDLIENSNPTHVAAFLYPFYLHCPLLKRDLCFAGSFTIAQAISLYQNMLRLSLSEYDGTNELADKLLAEFEEYLYKKGVPLGYANRRVMAIMKGLGSGFVYSGTYSG